MLSKLRLSHRLALGFGLVLALLLVTTWLGLTGMRALSQTLDTVVIRGAQRAQAIMAMERAANDYALGLRKTGGTELDQAEPLMKQIASASARYDAAALALAPLVPPTSETQALLGAASDGASALRKVVADAEKAGEGRGVTAVFFGLRQAVNGSDAAAWSQRQEAWQQALVALGDWDSRVNRELSVQTRADTQRARLLLIAGALIALALGGATAWWVTRDIGAGLRTAVDATRRIAAHDLSQPVASQRHDELGQLARSIEAMRLSLHGLAGGVREASQGIATASGQITQGSQDLSQRTEETAATLQATASAISQLTSMLDQTMQTAGSAGTLARDAQDVATRGGGVVADAVSTMHEIDGASRKIADIVAMIDSIAFQTNILALNAAVEAARAGDQGRGFAVVASEVRALAQRCAAAAREIKTLIQASLEKVESGSKQVQNAGGATTEIMSSVERVSKLVTTLSVEATQQRDGIGRTSASVAQLDTMAQQNAALAEESAAAAASLLAQATRLTGMVDQFKLEARDATVGA
ncbi:MAG TPA: methyl-accepting chemotaxis protein [Albitalea sp.]